MHPQRSAREIVPLRTETLTLLVVLVGFFTLPMSMSGTSVALPQIGAELNASGAPLQWVVSGYFLTASAFMLVAGSLGDLLGRRRIYRTGSLLYVLGFMGSAVAPSIELLLTARVVTGLGAAAVMAGGGALVGATFSGKERVQAFAAVGTTAGIGLAIGPSLSGWLVDGFGWRISFATFAFIGVFLGLGTLLMRETRTDHDARVDWAGASIFIVGLALFMLAITQGANLGWLSIPMLVLFGIVLTLGVAFITIERRVANPVLNLTLFESRRFVGWVVAATTMSFAFGGILAFLPTYLQGAGSYSAGQSGLLMLMPTAPMLFMPLIAGWLVNSGIPARVVIIVALVSLAGGNFWLTTLHAASTPVMLFGPLTTLGVGMGLAAGTIDAQAMKDVLPSQTGMVAGLLNTVRGTTQAVVLAIFGAALIGILTITLGSPETAGRVATGYVDASASAQQIEALTAAWRLVLAGIGALCAFGALVVFWLLRPTANTDKS